MGFIHNNICADSFGFFGLVVFGHGEICLARFKLSLRYFAKFRREMSSAVFPAKSRLALTGSLALFAEPCNGVKRKIPKKNLKIIKINKEVPLFFCLFFVSSVFRF